MGHLFLPYLKSLFHLIFLVGSFRLMIFDLTGSRIPHAEQDINHEQDNLPDINPTHAMIHT